MGNNTILSFITVLAFITVLFGLVSSTSPDILGNPLLDNDSVSNLATLLVQYDGINIVNSTTTNITVNSTFEGTEAFQREFLESKSVSQSDKSTIEKILGVPNLLLTSLGIESDQTVINILAAIVFVLAIMIGLVIYKGWKTGQVD